MESTNLVAVLGILVIAVVVVVVLLRVMRARHAAADRHAELVRADPPAPQPLTKEEAEYLDSSHISGPILPADTRAEDWRTDRK